MNAVFALQSERPPGGPAASSSPAARPLGTGAAGGTSTASNVVPSGHVLSSSSQTSSPPAERMETLCVGMEIPASATAFAQLVSLCKHAHSAGGTMLESDFHRRGKSTFTADEANTFLQIPSNTYLEGTIQYKLLRRGHFYCGKKGCKFAVPFTFHSTPKNNPRYEIVQSAGKEGNAVHFCLEHNHRPTSDAVATTDGKTLVSSEKDLAAAEIAEILRYASSHIDMPSMLLELRNKFKDREIHHEVIKRVLRKERDRIFGKDRHRIGELQEKGAEIRANGGLFKETISPQTYRLDSIAMQTSTMNMYSLQYGSYFSLMDGSFKTNMYGLQSIPVTTIDCLGKSTLTGLGCGLSESIINCTDLGREFGFAGSEKNDHVVCVSQYILPYVIYMCMLCEIIMSHLAFESHLLHM